MARPERRRPGIPIVSLHGGFQYRGEIAPVLFVLGRELELAKRYSSIHFHAVHT